MSDADDHGPEVPRTGVPRDLPDQEAAAPDEVETAGEADEEELPDTDEAGSRPRRSTPPPAEGEVAPPEPQEPTD